MEQETNHIQIEQEYMAYPKKDLLLAVYKEEGKSKACVYSSSDNTEDAAMILAAFMDILRSQKDSLLSKALMTFAMLTALLEAAKH